jgi:hypothetical protein
MNHSLEQSETRILLMFETKWFIKTQRAAADLRTTVYFLNKQIIMERTLLQRGKELTG